MIQERNMHRINVRKRTGKAFGSADVAGQQQILELLSNLEPHLREDMHAPTGTKFGGALLAPHLSHSDAIKVLRPALEHFRGKAKDPRIVKGVFDLQEAILKKNPELRDKLRQRHDPLPEKFDEIKDPYHDMDSRALYHHIMNLDHGRWAKVQEVAGQLAGKHPSVHGSHEKMPHILNHVTEKYGAGFFRRAATLTGLAGLGGAAGALAMRQYMLDNPTKFVKAAAENAAEGGYGSAREMVKEGAELAFGGSLYTGGSLNSGGDLTPHLLDISMSHHPKIAAERLEHLPDGPYTHALKASLYGASVAPMVIQ